MTPYIVEIPFCEQNDGYELDAANNISGLAYNSVDKLTEELYKLGIQKYYKYTLGELVALMNNGNDNFGDCYVANVYIG